jgi:hypothetical protein
MGILLQTLIVPAGLAEYLPKICALIDKHGFLREFSRDRMKLNLSTACEIDARDLKSFAVQCHSNRFNWNSFNSRKRHQ